jgi:hypothetical protein
MWPDVAKVLSRRPCLATERPWNQGTPYWTLNDLVITESNLCLEESLETTIPPLYGMLSACTQFLYYET